MIDPDTVFLISTVRYVLCAVVITGVIGSAFRCPDCGQLRSWSRFRNVDEIGGMTCEPTVVCIYCLVRDRLMGTKKYLGD